MSDERILVIAAHPDDEVLGCGGTLSKYSDVGSRIRVVFLAEGITARYQPEEFTNPEVVEQIELRNQNAFRAADILGIPRDQIFTSTRSCCRLDQLALIDLTKSIEEHLTDFLPTRVFIHSPHDPNVDHQVAHRASLAALRPIRDSQPKAVYAFEVLSSTEWNPMQPFTPNFFTGIGKIGLDRKVAALAAYGDEMRPSPHPRSPQVIKALASFRGSQAGLMFSEAFTLIRGIEV